jgi:hypothetical protein
MKTLKLILLAALFTGAAGLFSAQAWAGSCCGGGSATSLILPKYGLALIDTSLDVEQYNGLWNSDGKYQDQPNYHLWQYRLNLGYARRLASRWQASIVAPHVWNYNGYPGKTSRSNGVGDTSLSLWYEAREDKSAWKIRDLKDLAPSILIGPSLLIPTGASPYDGVPDSMDTTGRGFYRLDGNILIDKTIHPWSASLALSYGTHLERPVSREYESYPEPYHKKLGDRTSGVASVSYVYYLGPSGDALTGTASFSYLREADGTIDDRRDTTTGFRKEAIGGALAYSGTDHDWSLRASWSHAVRRDGWGENFPVTDIYSLGVRYVFR